MSIEKRLERVEAILDARGLDWDHPRVASDHFADANKMVADEPPKKWRILQPGEVVCSSDLMNAKSDFLSDPPNGPGWRPVEISAGMTVHKDDFCVFARLVADGPAKEPVDHLAAPRISPGEWLDIRDAYRDVTPADVGRLVYVRNGELEPWIELRLAEVTGADFPYRCTKDGLDPTMWQAFRYAVIRNERPANKAQPSWEPKVGDWVKVTRPQNWKERADPCWAPQMHHYDGKVGKIEGEWEGRFHICGFAWPSGLRFIFHRDWLSAAEPPASEKPAEPEYREPVLPADCFMGCEFSDKGEKWASGCLAGWSFKSGWIANNGVCWKHARIKKDA